MKKNFMAIASLLIAAMLLVVSCSQEVAPVDNGLVNVTLSTSVSGKALDVTGGKTGDISYSYSVTPLWDDDDVDTIVGTKDVTPIDTIEGNISLGYMSQGLWEIYVKGERNNEIVLEGTTDAYITKDSSNVVVFLKTKTGDSTANLSFNINVNDLENGGSGHDVLYSIAGTGTIYVNGASPSLVCNGVLSRGTVSETEGDTNHESVTKSATYGLPTDTTTITLSPGYYRVTVSLKEKAGDVVGGITKGFLVLNDDTALEVGGYVTAADFVNGTLNIVRPEVSVSLSAVVKKTGKTITEAAGYTITGENDSVTVVFTATPTSTTTNESGPVTASDYMYVWSIDGNEDTTTNSQTKEVTFAPGQRHVTCTVYKTYRFNNGITSYEEMIASSAYFDFTINK